MRIITRTVWVLSLVSLFTDMASEMLYPVLPMYLRSIGFSIVLIGVLEGFAEAMAGLSKGYFGKLSDHYGKRMPFVKLGYGLSAVAKPLVGLFAHPIGVFLARTADRFGKGVRTGARDAVLASEASPTTKATVFGFHRAMDTTGAVIGPAIALLYLHFYPGSFKTLFLFAFIPGVLSLLALTFLKEQSVRTASLEERPSFFSFIGYWNSGNAKYRSVSRGFLLFALFNSSDLFLLLNAKRILSDDTAIIGLYIFYNLVYAVAAFPFGKLADRLGMKKMYLLGLVLFSASYAGMAFATNGYELLLLFFVYGLFAAATEGISKAWLSTLVPGDQVATAIGTYAGFQSIAALVASSLAGWLWHRFGPEFALMSASVAAAVTVLYFLMLRSTDTKAAISNKI